MSCSSSVSELLEKLVLDDRGRALGEIALALACVLDGNEDKLTGAMAQSIPGTARELRATINQLVDGTPEADTFLEGLNT